MARGIALAAALALAAAGANGQTLLAPRQEVDFDRPEAWAMKYTASLVALTPLGPPEPLAAGAIELGLEAATVPSLSREERRVGFNGTKVEDIDRFPAYGRLRARAGLPHGLVAELGIVPPVRLDGFEPRFVAVALARRVIDVRRWAVDLRGSAQYGTLTGDVTCSRRDVSAGADAARNPLRCEAPSHDELTLRTAGAEVVVSPASRRTHSFHPYLAVGGHFLDATFQVDARYSGLVDRTRLATDGWTWSLLLGLAADAGPAWRWAGEIYYSPLTIRRPGRSSEVEPVANLRLLLARRLR